MNTLSSSKFFNKAAVITGFTKNLSKIDIIGDYKIPEELYKDRLGSFKAFKVPFVKEVVDYINKGLIVPVLLSESYKSSGKFEDLHVAAKVPHAIFNLHSLNSEGKHIQLVDLSYKANYQRNTSDGTIYYLNIPDLSFFYMCLAGYINLRIAENPEITSNASFNSKVAEAYSLILSKIIDNTYPISAAKDTDYDKLFFLCNCFCLQNMFDLSKADAIKSSLRMRLVSDKNGVLTESKYVNSDFDFMKGVDYKTIYPIDNFFAFLPKEYVYIDPKKISADLMLIKYNYRLTRNAIFAMESLDAFLTMLVLAKGSLGIYNDFMIKQYLELQSEDILKTLYNTVK